MGFSAYFLLALSCAVFGPATVQGTSGVMCYNCNSVWAAADSSSMTYHTKCDTNGIINEEYHPPVLCDTLCFSRVNRAPRGVVFRGCITGYPEEILGPGCSETAGGAWLCLCADDKCNNHNLTAKSLEFKPKPASTSDTDA